MSRGGAAAPVARAPSGTVLLVEDDHDVRVSLRALLESEGYEILTVTDGRSALEALQSVTPRPCLIILDLTLPVMDGWDFVAHLRRVPELAPIPIVVMSGSRHRPPPSGTIGFLKKPVDCAALLEVVAQHCRDDAGPR